MFRLRLSLLLPLILLVLSVQLPALAQKQPSFIANFQHYSIEEGLYNRHVHCFLEDNEGYMWIGTANGLHRFDGYSFQIFTSQKDSLKENSIGALAKDKNGYIWIFHSQHPNYPPKSIDILDPKTQSITPIEDFIEAPLPFAYDQLVDVFYLKEK